MLVGHCFRRLLLTRRQCDRLMRTDLLLLPLLTLMLLMWRLLQLLRQRLLLLL